MWLIDSSKIIQWIREGRNPVRILQPFIMADQLVTCGVIRIEVIRGAIKPAVREELSSLFDAIPEVQMTVSLWKRTTDIAWDLDRRGIVLPTTYLIIACCSHHARASIVTIDPHFDSIPGTLVCSELPQWE